MDIYIKPVRKAKLNGRKMVYLNDVAEVYAPQGVPELEHLTVFCIPRDKKASYLISGMDLVKAITNEVEGSTVNNLGEKDVVVEYDPKQSQNKKWVDFLKIAAIAVILFAGSATAIMSFNSDAQIGQVFEKYYEIFFGENAGKPYLLEIPYAVGLAVGITVFFNHFSKAHLTQDPTPIEVQMTTFEKETVECITDALDQEKRAGGRAAKP